MGRRGKKEAASEGTLRHRTGQPRLLSVPDVMDRWGGPGKASGAG